MKDLDNELAKVEKALDRTQEGLRFAEIADMGSDWECCWRARDRKRDEAGTFYAFN